MALTLVALFPAIFLIGYVYKKDRVEKEPVKLLAGLFFFGALTVIPAAVIENILDMVLGLFLRSDSLLATAVFSFLTVAVTEEFWKRWSVMRVAWNSPAFNYRFDAIVYCVTAAMGFAALENIGYVARGGFSVAFSRAMLAVPSHAVDGVLMGVFLGEAKICERAGDLEGTKRFWRLSLWIPVLAHGFYDFCLFRGTALSFAVFLVFVLVMDFYTVSRINRSAREDVRMDSGDWSL